MRNKLILSAVLILIILIFYAVQVYSVEMASKRDCVVCHVMWHEEFRTYQDTLIEFQPGNVLMKDTQGVVSSEEICYSCHDGYVRDSRYKVWNMYRHPVFVKPSNKVKIPPDLPLSVKGEIYCGTCHSAHGKGAAPHGDPMGRTKVYREVNIDSSLCEKCHVREVNYKRSNSHPVHTTALKLPRKLFDLGSKMASKKDMVICQTCHVVHGARAKKILLVDNRNSDLCILCHDKKRFIIGTKHDLRITLPEEKNIKGQSLSESGPCGACHTPHNAAGIKLWARKTGPGDNPSTMLCMSCHGEKGIFYKIRGIGKYTHPFNIAISGKINIPETLPLFLDDGTINPKGKVQCFTCHNVHQWDPSSPENRGGKDIEGDSSNSFLRVENISSGLCISCHVDKSEVTSSDHNLVVTAPESENIQNMTPSESGPCGACHIPHNASDKHLWARDKGKGEDFVTQVCTSCHKSGGIAEKKVISQYSHPINISLMIYGMRTDLPLYDKEGNVDSKNGLVACMTCHEPHKWNPVKKIENYTFKNIEGNAENSFLRKPASPSADLCISCHEDKLYILGTDHDLSVTAPEEKNILGETVKESGPCGACHLVHNSPNRIRLWARPYGPLRFDEEIMDSLCTSCHSKGNIAENKIPLIATHPEEKLINNVLRSDKTSIDYAPIYDKKTGEEIHVGNISCPTCHNAHKWSPLSKKRGVYKNIEGNATNSFLRNVSYNNICIDCHGLDALFRYKYFHDPEERVETKSPVINLFK